MKARRDSSSDEKHSDLSASKYQQQMPEATPPPDADLPSWTFRETLIGVVLTLVPWLALTTYALLGPASSAKPSPTQPAAPTLDVINGILTFVVQALLEGTFLIAPLWYAVFKPRRLARQQGLPEPDWREGLRALGLRRFSLWQGAAGLALGILAIYLASNLYATIAQALHVTIQTNVDQLQQQAASAPWTTLTTLMVAVIVAPFCEEIFFRGYFFQGLRLRLPIWAAIVVSSVIFGLAHGSPGSLALLIVIGVLLAILRWRTRSLWPGMALHMFNNFLGALIIFQSLNFH